MGIKLVDPKKLLRSFGEFYHYKDDIYWCFLRDEISENFSNHIGFYKKCQDGSFHTIKTYSANWDDSDIDISIKMKEIS